MSISAHSAPSFDIPSSTDTHSSSRSISLQQALATSVFAPPYDASSSGGLSGLPMPLLQWQCPPQAPRHIQPPPPASFPSSAQRSWTPPTTNLRRQSGADDDSGNDISGLWAPLQVELPVVAVADDQRSYRTKGMPVLTASPLPTEMLQFQLKVVPLDWMDSVSSIVSNDTKSKGSEAFSADRERSLSRALTPTAEIFQSKLASTLRRRVASARRISDREELSGPLGGRAKRATKFHFGPQSVSQGDLDVPFPLLNATDEERSDSTIASLLESNHSVGDFSADASSSTVVVLSSSGAT